MIRTVCRARRIVSGSGSSGSPIRTIEPASAAMSVPTPPRASPTSARARAGASLIPSPTIATTRPSCWRRRTHSALSAGVSSASTCLMWTFFATARAGAGRSPVRIVRSLQAQVLQVVDDVVRLAPDPVARADRRRRPRPSTATSRAVWPDLVERLQGLLDLGRDRRCPRSRTEAQVADEDRPRRPPIVADAGRDAGAGLGLEVVDLGQVEPERSGLGHEQARQRMLARPLGGGGQAEQVVLASSGRSATTVAQLGPALGQGAGLVEREGVDPRQPLEGRPPLDQHARGAPAGPSPPGRPRGWPGSGRTGRPRPARPGPASGRSPARSPVRPQRQSAGALVARKTSAAARQHGGQEEPGVAVGRRAPAATAGSGPRPAGGSPGPASSPCPTFSARTSSRPNWLNVPV